MKFKKWASLEQLWTRSTLNR